MPNLMLAVGFEELLGALVPIIFFVIWLINTIISARQQEQQKKALTEHVSEGQLNQETQQFLNESEEQDYAFSNDYEEPIEATIISAPRSSASNLLPHKHRIGSSLRESNIGGHINVQVDDHVHEVFDHHIGSLQPIATREHEDVRREKSQRDKTPKTANDFAVLFQDPDNVRQAIIMHEILKRR